MKSLSRRGMRVLVAAGLAVPAALAFSGPAHAETNPRCTDSEKIGATAYIVVGGKNAASVKQYKGCGKNYAYTYVWEQFRASHGSYQAGPGGETHSDETADLLDGLHRLAAEVPVAVAAARRP